MDHGLIIIVGIGNGFGTALTEIFGKAGYDIVLMGRDITRLEQQSRFSVEKVRDLKIHLIEIDVTDINSVISAFERVKDLKKPIDCLIYNAVARRNKKPSELTAFEVTEDFKVNVGGAVSCTHQALRLFENQNSGTVILTGGGVGINPSLIASSMSIGKAGLRNYAVNLHNELKNSNIFVGTVTITRPVREETECSPELVAGQFFRMFTERGDTEVII